jgi:orotidine-5'-phosphate decarboxylase
MHDLKLYDTPDTVQEVVKIAREQYQPRLLTVHPTAAKAAYSVAGEDASPSSPSIISVPILTSQEAQGDTSLYHYFHHQAARRDCHGFVCAAPDLPAARKACVAAGRPGMILVCPGIRLAGEDHHNHRRFGTPEAAIEAGADYLVVGRPIIEAADPAAAAQKFMPG